MRLTKDKNVNAHIGTAACAVPITRPTDSLRFDERFGRAVASCDEVTPTAYRAASIADLRPGESTSVRHIAESPLKRRLQELGLDSGVTVTCLFRSPLGDPTAYEFASGIVAIRRTDAESVKVWG